jgi:hypothetical protein
MISFNKHHQEPIHVMYGFNYFTRNQLYVNIWKQSFIRQRLILLQWKDTRSSTMIDDPYYLLGIIHASFIHKHGMKL